MLTPKLPEGMVYRRPIPEDFDQSSEFPRGFRALGLVGIPNYKGVPDHMMHWKVGTVFHTSAKFKPGMNFGRNEHGVDYVPKAWLPLPDAEDI